MGRGRKVFPKIKPIILVLAKLFSVFGRRGNLFLFAIFRSFPGDVGKIIRYIFMKNCLKKLGDNVIFGPGVYIKNPQNIEIGDIVAINEMCYIEGAGGISIGNEVLIAHSTTIISSNHSFNDKTKSISLHPVVTLPIKLEDDIWVGCGVRILAGVTLKKRTIVAAGAVVTKSFSENSLIGGVPAKLIKKVNPD